MSVGVVAEGAQRRYQLSVVHHRHESVNKYPTMNYCQYNECITHFHALHNLDKALLNILQFSLIWQADFTSCHGHHRPPASPNTDYTHSVSGKPACTHPQREHLKIATLVSRTVHLESHSSMHTLEHTRLSCCAVQMVFDCLHSQVRTMLMAC